MDFLARENSVSHHTDKYELAENRLSDDLQLLPPQLVIRRGDPFDIAVTFNRPFNKAKDDIKLVFSCGRLINVFGLALYRKLIFAGC